MTPVFKREPVPVNNGPAQLGDSSIAQRHGQRVAQIIQAVPSSGFGNPGPWFDTFPPGPKSKRPRAERAPTGRRPQSVEF